MNTRDIISVTLYYLSEIKKDMEKHKINITQEEMIAYAVAVALSEYDQTLKNQLSEHGIVLKNLFEEKQEYDFSQYFEKP